MKKQYFLCGCGDVFVGDDGVAAVDADDDDDDDGHVLNVDDDEVEKDPSLFLLEACGQL